jgi:hypothetical protein
MDNQRAADPGDRTAPEGDGTPDRTVSAGESGSAVGDIGSPTGGRVDVVVGEIPDPENLAHMLWTARCDCADHGLLGTFEERTLAEECRERHLVEEHGRRESQ